MPMDGIKALAVVLAALLLGSVVPLSLAETNTSANNTNTTGTYTGTMDNSTREMVIAENLVEKLQKLSKFAEKKIGPIKDRLPTNSSILKNYNLAEEFKDKAIEEYGAGDYYNSILDSLTAMHYYKAALSALKGGKEKVNNARERIRMEIERTRDYFRFVDKTIRLAENQGIDVSNLTQLYNETKKAYEVVLNDLRTGDYEKAKVDLNTAREKKVLLDKELRKVREELAYANADKIVKEFLVKGEKGIEIAEKAIQLGEEKGYNVTELQRRLNAFSEVYNQVKTLADEKKWEDALNVMQENRETIVQFHRAIELILQRSHEKELNEKIRDVKAFLREMQDRIQRDAKALKDLEKKGVNTGRAEMQLRVATQEFKTGVALLRAKKPMEARTHFRIAIELLDKVESFINAHS